MTIDLAEIKRRSPSYAASEAAARLFRRRCETEREEMVVDVGFNGTALDLPSIEWMMLADRVVAGDKVLKDRWR